MRHVILVLLFSLTFLFKPVVAQPLKDFTFKSPAFNGNGYSAHVLTIENQEHSRKKAIADKIEAKLKQEQEQLRITYICSNITGRCHSNV